MTRHPMRVLRGLLIAGALAGCSEQPTQQQTLATGGVTEITITGITTSAPSTSARWVPVSSDRIAPNLSVSGVAASPTAVTLTPLSTVAPLDGSIQLDPVSVSTFTVGPRPGGFRYVAATYRVRNATQGGDPYPDARSNLTFVALSSGTLAASAIRDLKKFDGSSASFSATLVAPTGVGTMDRAKGTVSSSSVDALQVFTEAELATAGNASLIPYGFVVSNPNDPNSRTLPATPGGNQFEGLVTFAFKYPLQASATDDAFTIVGVFQAVDDNTAVVLQSMEDSTAAQQSAVTSRATAIGASLRSLLGTTVNAQAATQMCGVRSAGPSGSPTATVPGSC